MKLIGQDEYKHLVPFLFSICQGRQADRGQRQMCRQGHSFQGDMVYVFEGVVKTF